jgi:hypothetical protein
MHSLRIDEFELIVWVLCGLFTDLGASGVHCFRWVDVFVYRDGVHWGWLIWANY